jgi:hypothetical protein
MVVGMNSEVKLLQGCQMMSSRNEISLGNGKKKMLLLLLLLD